MEWIIEENDSVQEQAKKIVYLFAGSSSELQSQLSKIGVKYTKLQRGLYVVYVLRHKSFGRCEVKL